MASVMPMVVATAMSTDHKAGPKDHREDKDDAGNDDDSGRDHEDPMWPTSIPPRGRVCGNATLCRRF